MFNDEYSISWEGEAESHNNIKWPIGTIHNVTAENLRMKCIYTLIVLDRHGCMYVHGPEWMWHGGTHTLFVDCLFTPSSTVP